MLCSFIFHFFRIITFTNKEWARDQKGGIKYESRRREGEKERGRGGNRRAEEGERERKREGEKERGRRGVKERRRKGMKN